MCPALSYQPRIRSRAGPGHHAALADRPGLDSGRQRSALSRRQAAGPRAVHARRGHEGQNSPEAAHLAADAQKTVKEGNRTKPVDDIDRTLRLEGDPTFGPDQTDVTVNVLVPSDLPKQPWDLVLVAELLSADGKSVVSSLAAPVRTLSPVAPFTLALTGESTAEGKAGTGEPGKLDGQNQPLARLYAAGGGDARQSAQGLYAAAGAGARRQERIRAAAHFASSSEAGRAEGREARGVSAPAGGQVGQEQRDRVAIKVVPGEKPACEQPKEVFEDDEKFIAMLTEGNGRAIPDQRQAFSGKYAIRVTPDQKFNTKLPNLGVKIRENPGPGRISLSPVRLAKGPGQHDLPAACSRRQVWSGRAGAAAAKGAKFRYHAGPGEELFGASLQIADKIPAKFELVTRDLFIDFGEFTLTGLAFSPVDGQAALFDHISVSPARWKIFRCSRTKSDLRGAGILRHSSFPGMPMHEAFTVCALQRVVALELLHRPRRESKTT